MKITLGHSPDSDDAFMFYPLAHNLVETGDYQFEHILQDIETLISHFLSVSWGPVIPPNEVTEAIEGTKGVNSYYLVSDGSTSSYRTRIRTPTFPGLQMIPYLSRGFFMADLVAIVASIDFVMADVDR